MTLVERIEQLCQDAKEEGQELKTYTHVGMKGLAARETLDVDPILNRNRKWHACNHIEGNTYQAVCGVNFLAVDPDESAWGSRVAPKEGHRITCRRCKRALGTVFCPPQTQKHTNLRCASIGPAPEQYRCGNWRGHAGAHTALIPTGAPWFGEP